MNGLRSGKSESWMDGRGGEGRGMERDGKGWEGMKKTITISVFTPPAPLQPNHHYYYSTKQANRENDRTQLSFP